MNLTTMSQDQRDAFALQLADDMAWAGETLEAGGYGFTPDELAILVDTLCGLLTRKKEEAAKA